MLSHLVMPDSLQTHEPARLLCPRGPPGKNTEVCCRALLTQGSNLGLLHCKQICYHISHIEYIHILIKAFWTFYKYKKKKNLQVVLNVFVPEITIHFIFNNQVFFLVLKITSRLSYISIQWDYVNCVWLHLIIHSSTEWLFVEHELHDRLCTTQ